VVTTWASLATGGAEQNPFVAAALGSGHFLLFAAVKVALVAALGIVLVRGRPEALAASRALVVLFAAVALGNLLATIT